MLFYSEYGYTCGMDPFSHALTGATLAGLGAPRRLLKPAIWIGAFAGMAPDLDVFIRSSSDPLLWLEFHRHFTHSMFFTPIGALACAAFFWLFSFTRRHVRFIECWAFAFLGYATHCLLDSCTSYGTRLLMPLSNLRISWDIIGIVDLFYTLPVLALLLMGYRRVSFGFVTAACIWGLSYLGLGYIQHERVLSLATEWASRRATNPQMLSVRPTIGNLWLWRTFYRDGEFWQTAAIRAPFWPGGKHRTYEGQKALVAPANLLHGYPADSIAAYDIARFNYFSSGYLAQYKGQDGTTFYGDVRYGMLPLSAKPLWAIALPENCPDCHVTFVGLPRIFAIKDVRRLLAGEDFSLQPEFVKILP